MRYGPWLLSGNMCVGTPKDMGLTISTGSWQDTITLFRSITMFYGTDSIMWNILHSQYECGEYSIEYCQSHITLLWIWILYMFPRRQPQFLRECSPIFIGSDKCIWTCNKYLISRRKISLVLFLLKCPKFSKFGWSPWQVGVLDDDDEVVI